MLCPSLKICQFLKFSVSLFSVQYLLVNCIKFRKVLRLNNFAISICIELFIKGLVCFHVNVSVVKTFKLCHLHFGIKLFQFFVTIKFIFQFFNIFWFSRNLSVQIASKELSLSLKLFARRRIRKYLTLFFNRIA